MKVIAKFFALALAVFGAQMISTSAMAQGTPPATGSYSGIVAVQKGLAFDCLLTLNVDATTSTVGVSLTPGNPACASLSFVGNPYTYSYNATTGDFTVFGVYVNTITAGNCAGNITATWDATTQEFDVNTFLPTAGAGPNCTVSGFVS